MNRRELFAAPLVLLAACNRNQKKRIAVIPKSTSHIFWVSVHAGAAAAGEEFGVEILWNGAPVESDVNRQIQIVDSMIAQHVDGLAVAVSERKALVAPVERAVQAGIPVTIFDSGVDTTNYMSYVATNNTEGGRLAGRTLGNLVGGKGKVALIAHQPGSVSTMEREAGFEEVMKNEFPGIVIVQRPFTMGDPAKAMSVTENVLSAHPDLAGLFATAEPGSLGTAQGIKSRNAGGKVKFVAFDSSDSMIADMRAGVINAMVVQDPFKMGYETVKTIVDKLSGIQPPKQLDLPAVVITLENLDKPDVKKLLSPDVSKVK
jgi:ribose transport system substrate-binding protein